MGWGGRGTVRRRASQREGEGGERYPSGSSRGFGVTLRVPDKERARAIYGTVALTSHRAPRFHLEGRIRIAQATGGFSRGRRQLLPTRVIDLC